MGVLAFALTTMMAASTRAEPPSKSSEPEGKPFHSTFFGEGGSYQDPSPEVKRYLEEEGQPAQREARKETADAGPAPVPTPESHAPARRAPARPRDAFIRKDPASLRYKRNEPETELKDAPNDAEARGRKAPAPAEDGRLYSLYEGISAPLALPAEKIKDVSPDQASLMVRQDYESHILGAPAGPQVNGMGAAAAPSAPVAPVASPETFVSFDLDLKGMALKDAVAGLSSSAGFRQDERFATVLSDPNKAAIFGWLPLDKLTEVMKLPFVARLQTDGRAAPAAHQGLMSRILVGIRVPAGRPVGETYDRVLRELSASAHFRLERTVGYQPVPGGSDLAVVIVGEAPILELSKIMGSPDVLKVLPAPVGESAEAEAPVRDPAVPRRAAPPSSESAKFLFFVEKRAPLLLVVTLLLLLAPMGGRAARTLRVFSPYR